MVAVIELATGVRRPDIPLASGAAIAADPWDGRLPRQARFRQLLALRNPRAEMRDLTPILDELRSMDWVPRLVRARAHQLERALQTLEAHLGRMPNLLSGAWVSLDQNDIR